MAERLKERAHHPSGHAKNTRQQRGPLLWPASCPEGRGRTCSDHLPQTPDSGLSSLVLGPSTRSLSISNTTSPSANNFYHRVRIPRRQARCRPCAERYVSGPRRSSRTYTLIAASAGCCSSLVSEAFDSRSRAAGRLAALLMLIFMHVGTLCLVMGNL